MTTERVAMELLITTELQKAKSDLKDMHSSLKNLESAANSLGNALKGGLVLLGLDKLVGGISGTIESTMQWDIAAQKLAATMSGNATAATTWLAIGKALGIEDTQIEIGMKSLSNAVYTNSAALRQMGVATVDGHGKFLALGQVVNSVADYFHAHEGATDNAALAVQLFGRNNAQLLPILELGSASIQQLSDHFRALGYVVNGDALEGFRQADAQFRDGQMAVQGLAMAVTHALMPGLAALAGGLTDIIEAKMPEFIAAIQSAVSFVIGFFEGLTGGKATMSDTAQTLGKVSAAVHGYGDASGGAAGASNALAEAEKRVREQAKAATDAINEQIRSLENMTAVENFQDQQRKLHAKLIDDNKKVDELYAAYQTDLLHGYEAQAMGQLVSLQAAEQTAADDSTEIDKGAKQEQRRTLIDTLREQERAINASADKQIAAMQRAAAGSSAAIAGVAAGIPPLFTKAGADMGFALNKASEQAGKDMAATFKRGDWAGVGSQIGQGIIAGLGAAIKAGLGKAIFGDSIDSKGRVDWVKFLVTGNWKPTGTAGSNTSPGPDPFGGIVQGQQPGGMLGNQFNPYNPPPNRPPDDRSMVNHIYINGAGNPERVGQATADAIGRLMAA